MHLMIVPGMLACSKLSDMCVYVYCVESFAHIECYSDCSRRGLFGLTPLLRCLLCVVPSL